MKNNVPQEKCPSCGGKRQMQCYKCSSIIITQIAEDSLELLKRINQLGVKHADNCPNSWKGECYCDKESVDKELKEMFLDE